LREGTTLLSAFLPAQLGEGRLSLALIIILVSLENDVVHFFRQNSSQSEPPMSVLQCTRDNIVAFMLERDLLPLLIQYSTYPSNYGDSPEVQYDIPLIFNGLVRNVFGRARKIDLSSIGSLCQHFNGTTAFVHHLDRLNKREVAQAHPPAVLLNNFIDKAVKRQLLTSLLSVLHSALAFLATVSGDDVPLFDFLHQKGFIMGNEPLLELFREFNFSLSHLVAIWAYIEVEQSRLILHHNVQLFDFVGAQFRVPFDAQISYVAPAHSKRKFAALLLTFIHLHLDRADSNIVTAPSWDLASTLAQTEYMPVFEPFRDLVAHVSRLPSELTVAHIVHLFETLLD
jgi:hypothetical protein